MTTFTVSSGVTSSGLTVANLDNLIVLSGGTAVDTLIQNGGSAELDGGVAIRTVVTAGAVISANSGGVASNTILSGGQQGVFFSGLALSTTVLNGGVDGVFSGGQAAFSVISNGGAEIVFTGGGAGFGTVSSGGDQTISSGGFGTAMLVDNGGFEIVVTGGVAIGNFVASGGNDVIFSGGLVGSTTISSGGFESISSGGTAIGDFVQSGGTQVVFKGGTASATVVSGGGEQVIHNGGSLAGTFLLPEGSIDLPDLPFVTGGSANMDYSDDLVTITEGTNVVSGQLAGDYTGEFFHPAQDAGTGTIITVDGTPCYCRGTRVLASRGEIEVQDLRVGDHIFTHRGDTRRIRWIGQRSYAGRFAAGNRELLPIRISAGALEDGVPKRDLFVSPMHAMYLDGVLIPAGALLNGSSITQVETVDQVEYFHIELDTHDVILAEGAPSETFVDDDSRGMFHNAAEFRILYPDARPERPRFCAPRVEDGEILETVRNRLALRAKPASRAARAPGKLLGCVDVTRRDRICGWAYDEAARGEPVRLRIYNNDIVIGEVVADGFRPDLKAAGIGDGNCGFELAVPGGLSPQVRHVINARRASDGRDLPNTPWILKAEPPAAAIVVTSETGYDGCVDRVTRERITGWAWNPSNPETPAALQILDNGVPIARVLANLHRADLEKAGIGTGRHGFDIIIPGALSPLARHVVQIRGERDGVELAGSPVIIEPANSFDATLQQAVANAVASVAASGEQERVLSFILAQADRLRQQHADEEANRSERVNARLLRRRLGPAADDIAEPARRALVIDTRLPRATRDAGSQAILSHMVALRRLGYEVSLVAADEIASQTEASFELEAMGITCHRAPFYSSVEDVLRRQGDCIDVVYLHRADIATRYLTLARALCPRARIVYSVADLHHVRLERQAAIEERPELLTASRRMRLMECTSAWSADAVITHSSVEAALLRQLVPEANVHQVGWELPLRPATIAARDKHGVAFIGSYGHTPNVDAARWLVETIMPLVWATDPSIECLLVGSEMPATVRDLARPGVVILGEVAELHTSVYDRVRLTVAPLRYGAGIKGKVLDGLAAGVPCVMSGIAAEGLPLPAALRALVGHDAETIAALICQLHQVLDDYETVATAGLSMIGQNFNADAITSALRPAIEGLRQSAERPSSETSALAG